ncbi:hypothetical protein BDV3_006567 [Batrachochytrium dendrobatidis]
MDQHLLLNSDQHSASDDDQLIKQELELLETVEQDSFDTEDLAEGLVMELDPQYIYNSVSQTQKSLDNSLQLDSMTKVPSHSLHEHTVATKDEADSLKYTHSSPFKEELQQSVFWKDFIESTLLRSEEQDTRIRELESDIPDLLQPMDAKELLLDQVLPDTTTIDPDMFDAKDLIGSDATLNDKQATNLFDQKLDANKALEQLNIPSPQRVSSSSSPGLQAECSTIKSDQNPSEANEAMDTKSLLKISSEQVKQDHHTLFQYSDSRQGMPRKSKTPSGGARRGSVAPKKTHIATTPDTTSLRKSEHMDATGPDFTILGKHAYSAVSNVSWSKSLAKSDQTKSLIFNMGSKTREMRILSDIEDNTDLEIKHQQKLSQLETVTQSEEDILKKMQHDGTEYSQTLALTSTSYAQIRHPKQRSTAFQSFPHDVNSDLDGQQSLNAIGSSNLHLESDHSQALVKDELNYSHRENIDPPTLSQIPFDLDELSLFMCDADPNEIVEAGYLKALILKYESELQWIQGKIKEERHTQKEIKFRIESVLASKTSYTRAMRNFKNKLLCLNGEIRDVTFWISVESKNIYDREKDRSNMLVARTQDFVKQFLEKKSKDLRQVELAQQRKLEAEEQSMKIRTNAADLRIQCYEIDETLKCYSADIENIKWEVAKKQLLRDEAIEAILKKEAIAQECDLRVLNTALERQQLIGKKALFVEDLEVVDLSDAQLARIPKLLIQSKRVKHVDIDKNDLKKSSVIQQLPELISLRACSNRFEKLELAQLLKLRSLTVENNGIMEISGLTDELTYLDISSNPISKIDSISAATSLQVLLLRNSRVQDLSSFRFLKGLIYVDLGECRLTESSADNLIDSPLLQYVSMAKNIVSKFPEFYNPLLYELNLNLNAISRLQITNWLGRLQVLNLDNNQITDIEPLSMCPFLRILSLENNKIQDITNVYSISVCQQLQVLNLSDNPVELNPTLYKIVGTMFQNLKLLNKHQVCRTVGDPEKKMFFYTNPLKSVRVCVQCIDHLSNAILEEFDINDSLKIFEEWAKFLGAKDQSITEFMGQYRSPYLDYLTSPAIQYSKDPLVRLQIQERRLFILTGLLNSMIQTHATIPIPTVDMIISVWIFKLKGIVDTYKVIYIQSIWRMRKNRKLYQKNLNDYYLCQKLAQKWCKCRAAKTKLVELRQKKLHRCAMMIQKCFRGYMAKKMAAPQKMKKLKEPFDMNQGLDLEILQNDPSHWLESTNINQFDEKLKDYLATEELVHFSSNNTFDVKKEEIPFEVSCDLGNRKNTVKPYPKKHKVDTTKLGIQRGELIKKITSQYAVLSNISQPTSTQYDYAQTFSNNSGIYSSGVARSYISPPADITIVQKQLDIEAPVQKPFLSPALAQIQATKQNSKDIEAGVLSGHTKDRLSSEPIEPIDLKTDEALKLSFHRILEGCVQSAFHHQQAQHEFLDDDDGFVLIQNQPVDKTAYTFALEQHHLQQEDAFPSKHNKSIGQTTVSHERNQYMADTQTLSSRQRKKMQIFEPEQQKNQMDKDSIHRYQAFEAVDKFKKIPKKPVDLKDVSVIYEWDIHRGDTTRKLLSEQSLQNDPHPPNSAELQVVGPGAESLKAPSRMNNPPFAPKVTLLVNNYVASKLQNASEEQQPIHRWLKNNTESMISVKSMDKQSNATDIYRSTFKPRYTTDIGRVSSTVPIPPLYGKYKLYRHSPLPSIAQPTRSSK